MENRVQKVDQVRQGPEGIREKLVTLPPREPKEKPDEQDCQERPDRTDNRAVREKMDVRVFLEPRETPAGQAEMEILVHLAAMVRTVSLGCQEPKENQEFLAYPEGKETVDCQGAPARMAKLAFQERLEQKGKTALEKEQRVKEGDLVWMEYLV